MILMLTACAAKPKGTEIKTVEKNGDTLFAIYDYDAKTIRVGSTLASVYGPDGELIWEEDRKDEYRYEYDNGDITIHYPNGATYWESASANGAIGGWDGNYDTERYIDGMILAMQLTQAYNNSGKDWDYVVVAGLFGIVMIIVGIFMIKDPETMIQLEYGLRFYHVEPTEFYIGATRVSGVVLIAGAVILFLVALYA